MDAPQVDSVDDAPEVAAALTRTRKRLARLALVAFVFVFVAARVLVYLIMSRRIPDLYLYVGQTHVHHLNYGIFLLSGVGAYLLLARPEGRALRRAALVYGVGLGLTFDEFGMWIHLGGPYWQRASYDAVVVVAAVLALLAGRVAGGRSRVELFAGDAHRVESTIIRSVRLPSVRPAVASAARWRSRSRDTDRRERSGRGGHIRSGDAMYATANASPPTAASEKIFIATHERACLCIGDYLFNRSRMTSHDAGGPPFTG